MDTPTGNNRVEHIINHSEACYVYIDCCICPACRICGCVDYLNDDGHCAVCLDEIEARVHDIVKEW